MRFHCEQCNIDVVDTPYENDSGIKLKDYFSPDGKKHPGHHIVSYPETTPQ